LARFSFNSTVCSGSGCQENQEAARRGGVGGCQQQ
jgi:hypothetical protein